ncbi:hypothetical protein PYCC9005_004621 [Savitreella phatthalungensis]
MPEKPYLGIGLSRSEVRPPSTHMIFSQKRPADTDKLSMARQRNKAPSPKFSYSDDDEIPSFANLMPPSPSSSTTPRALVRKHLDLPEPATTPAKTSEVMPLDDLKAATPVPTVQPSVVSLPQPPPSHLENEIRALGKTIESLNRSIALCTASMTGCERQLEAERLTNERLRAEIAGMQSKHVEEVSALKRRAAEAGDLEVELDRVKRRADEDARGWQEEIDQLKDRAHRANEDLLSTSSTLTQLKLELEKKEHGASSQHHRPGELDHAAGAGQEELVRMERSLRKYYEQGRVDLDNRVKTSEKVAADTASENLSLRKEIEELRKKITDATGYKKLPGMLVGNEGQRVNLGTNKTTVMGMGVVKNTPGRGIGVKSVPSRTKSVMTNPGIHTRSRNSTTTMTIKRSFSSSSGSPVTWNE